MEFTPITEREFMKIQRRGGAASSELGDIIRDLELNTGFSIPCVWSHSTYEHFGRIKVDGTRLKSSYNRCSGINAVYNCKARLNKRNNENRRISCRCVDGTLYVFRVA